MNRAQRLWPRFLASLALHTVALGCVACVWARHATPAIPLFQVGEFSVELAGSAPTAGRDDADPVAPDLPAADAPVAEFVSRAPAAAPIPPPMDAPEPADPDPREPEALPLDTLSLAVRPKPATAPVETITSRRTLPPAARGSGQPVFRMPADVVAAAAGPGRPGRSAGAGGTPGKSTGVNTPRLAAGLNPPYPPGARARGEEGRVTVRASVTASGQALSAEVVNSSGYAALDQAALNAVRRARFIPARKGWTAVASDTLLTFRFNLVD